jgi:carboxylesterase type B
MQSTYFYSPFFTDIASVKSVGDSVITSFQQLLEAACNGVVTSACLRSIPVAAISQMQQFTNSRYTFQPSIGSEIVPIHPAIAFKTGKIQNIPILTGILI